VKNLAFTRHHVEILMEAKFVFFDHAKNIIGAD